MQKIIVLEQDTLCKWRIKPKELKEVTEVSKSIVEYQLLYNAIGINQSTTKHQHCKKSDQS